jgi:hypothetical protein
MTNKDDIIEEKFTVLARRQKSGAYEYWDGSEFDTDIDCAEDFTGSSPSDIVESILEVCEEMECGADELEAVKAERCIRITDSLTLDEQRILEAQRAKAISKLTAAELKVLGLGNIATYSKIKFHNSPEEEL